MFIHFHNMNVQGLMHDSRGYDHEMGISLYYELFIPIYCLGIIVRIVL
jgi:hypothetical protein